VAEAGRAGHAPALRRVRSSSIAAIGYDEDAREVYVQFRHGGVYAYAGVPREIWDELQRADSKGRFVNLVLKPLCRCRRV
jgi:KTSC domain